MRVSPTVIAPEDQRAMRNRFVAGHADAAGQRARRGGRSAARLERLGPQAASWRLAYHGALCRRY